MKNALKEIERLANSGQLDAADRLFAQLKLPASVMWMVSASLAFKRGDLQKAEVEFDRALQLDPNNAAAAGNLATLLFNQKKVKKALPLAELAYKAVQDSESFARIYAACLADSDRFTEALAILEPFVNKPEPTVSALVSYASLLRATLKPEEALVILERTRQLYPDHPEAEKGIADAYAELDPKVAQKAFRAAEKRLPNAFGVKWNASFVELRLRNFRRGWKLYEYGLTEEIGKIGRPLPPQAKVLPMVTEVRQLDPRKWTLLCAEQGLGDQVLFLGCVREFLKRFPKTVLIGEDRMVELLQRSFPEIAVYTYGFAAGLGNQAHRINGMFPIGSMMKLFRPSIESFTAHRVPYIVPNSSRVEKYRAALTGKIPGKKLVGISWRGGFWERQQRTKSFEFELFGRLMQQLDCQYISLQYGDVAVERALAKRMGWPVTFVEGIDFKKNIDDWVSLACACDRIISVSTALVHFAGAAGKHVDLLIGDYQAPFIWGLESGPSLPYADVHIWRKRGSEESLEEFFDRVGRGVS